MKFNFYGITENILDELSYKSKLGKSLKNTLTIRRNSSYSP
ncbi:hypothetical protein [Clostridioides sp. ZZV15-6597]